MENKNSFFFIDLTFNTDVFNNFDKVKNSLDLIYDSMGVSSEVNSFQNDNRIIALFKTEKRKRNGQLDKFCKRYLDEDIKFETSGVLKDDYLNYIKILKDDPKYKTIEIYKSKNHYNGEDIEIFKDKENWHNWQKEIYEKLYNNYDEIKKPDPRKIISIIDDKGNSGKSSFFKWLYFINPDQVGRITYGTASQLRSVTSNMGAKKIYIIDLARAKSKNDKEEDLLSIIEDLKSGFVINVMYGNVKTLMMEPPHIIVSSNYELDYNYLSEGRWLIYKITKSKELKQIKNNNIL